MKMLLIIMASIFIGCSNTKIEYIEVPVNDTIIIRDTVYIGHPTKETVYQELINHEIPEAKIVLAQAIVETGNFTSKLTKTHHNIFGIRYGKKYKKYNNYIECIKDYKRLFSDKYKGNIDYYKYLERIGYAENPSYTNILKGVVKTL